MKPRQTAIQELSDAGYQFERHGGNHDIYYNSLTHQSIALKRHDFDECDLRYIRKEIKQNNMRG